MPIINAREVEGFDINVRYGDLYNTLHIFVSMYSGVSLEDAISDQIFNAHSGWRSLY